MAGSHVSTSSAVMRENEAVPWPITEAEPSASSSTAVDSSIPSPFDVVVQPSVIARAMNTSERPSRPRSVKCESVTVRSRPGTARMSSRSVIFMSKQSASALSEVIVFFSAEKT